MDALQLLTIVLGIAGIAGGAAGYFAKSRGDTIIQLQGKEIDYWKNTATECANTTTALKAQSLEKDERITALINQNKLSAALAQGSPELIKLRREITKQSNIIKKIINGKK